MFGIIKKISNLLRESKYVVLLLLVVFAFVGNIVGWLSMPFARIGILFSNVISLVIFIAALPVIKHYMHSAVSKEAVNDVLLRQKIDSQEKQLREKQGIIKDLEDKLDTERQNNMMQSWVSCNPELVLANVNIGGNEVKKRKIADFSEHKVLKDYLPKKTSIFQSDPSRFEILYIRRVIHQSSIGILLKNIRCSMSRSGQLLLSGVDIRRLHDLEYEGDKQLYDNSINLTEFRDGNSIKTYRNDSQLAVFKEQFEHEIESEMKQSRRNIIENYCAQLTEMLHRSIHDSNTNILFIPESGHIGTSYSLIEALRRPELRGGRFAVDLWYYGLYQGATQF